AARATGAAEADAVALREALGQPAGEAGTAGARRSGGAVRRRHHGAVDVAGRVVRIAVRPALAARSVSVEIAVFAGRRRIAGRAEPHHEQGRAVRAEPHATRIARPRASPSVWIAAHRTNGASVPDSSRTGGPYADAIP